MTQLRMHYCPSVMHYCTAYSSIQSIRWVCRVGWRYGYDDADDCTTYRLLEHCARDVNTMAVVQSQLRGGGMLDPTVLCMYCAISHRPYPTSASTRTYT